MQEVSELLKKARALPLEARAALAGSLLGPVFRGEYTPEAAEQERIFTPNGETRIQCAGCALESPRQTAQPASLLPFSL
jgi:hypothetical protein